MAKKRKTTALGKGKKLRPFHQFSRFPTELRSRVWDLVDPEPRIVELRPHRGENNLGSVQQIRCLTKAPAILHVCREARQSAINRKLYQRAFVLGETSTWINFDVDMISIKPIDFSWIKMEKPLIQRFRFEGENDSGFFHFRSKEVKEFTHLRELHIICEDGVMFWINIAEEMDFPTENVFFIAKGSTGTRMYSRQQLFELYPSRPYQEYSNSYYRQIYDERIKGSEGEMPEDYF